MKLNGTSFQIKVWKALKKIKKGKVKTYKEIAIAINRPKAARAVANACAKNPYAPKVPCHRVIRSDGTLGEIFIDMHKEGAALALCPIHYVQYIKVLGSRFEPVLRAIYQQYSSLSSLKFVRIFSKFFDRIDILRGRFISFHILIHHRNSRNGIGSREKDNYQYRLPLFR